MNLKSHHMYFTVCESHDQIPLLSSFPTATARIITFLSINGHTNPFPSSGHIMDTISVVAASLSSVLPVVGLRLALGHPGGERLRRAVTRRKCVRCNVKAM